MDHLVTSSNLSYRLDKEIAPAAHIDSGDRVVFKTLDARSGSIQKNEDLLDAPHPLGANPVTGPVAVSQAAPGDALCVEIETINLDSHGFLATKARQGLLGHLAEEFATRIVSIKSDTVDFGEGVRFAASPMVGVIGTAPAAQPIDSLFPGPHGGNMDNKLVRAGARVYLPVGVEGALLFLGDVHGSMGDGEITYIGLEIAAEVTVRVEVKKNFDIDRPLIETPNSWVTTGDHFDPAEALRMAAGEMVQLLQRNLDLSFADAYMLASGAVDVQICQCCDPGNFPVTTRAVVSKDLMPSVVTS